MEVKHRVRQHAVFLIEDKRPLLGGFRPVLIPRDRPAIARTSVRMNAQERELTGLIAAGFGNSEIAGRLGIDARTVGAHVRSIVEKLTLRSHLEHAAESRARIRRARGSASGR